jgi:hypothetical protein
MYQINGTNLTDADRRYVLAAYVHRFTGDHTPTWVKRQKRPCKMQFKDDADWLANTLFFIRKDGRLDRRAKRCESTPTWPNGQ